MYVCCEHDYLHERNIIELYETFHFVLHLLLCVNVSWIRIWTFLDTWSAIVSSICILYINTHVYIYLFSWNRGNEIAGVFSLLLASMIMYINISRSRFYDVYCLFFVDIYVMWISESSWENWIVIVGLVYGIMHPLSCI